MEDTLEGGDPGGEIEDSGNAETLLTPGAQPRGDRGPHRPLRIGRFTVIDEIGRGGMGIVYAAYDPDLDRKIAVKVLQPVAESTEEVTEGRARLLREAQAMARLSHPNVATVHEVGTMDDMVFLAMEFIEGHTLKGWVSEEGHAGWAPIVTMYRQAGRGLAAAHLAGLIHRDFKPDNVLVDADGRAKVLDFGLARAQHDTDPAAAERATTVSSSSLDSPLTLAGRIMGTPAYMAPEQFMGERLDERSDQFSFCVSLYEALYGERPFPAKNFMELRLRVLQGGPPTPPDQSSVPAWVLRVLLRGLSRHPAERYESMEELLEALEEDPAARRRRVGGWLAAGVLVAAGLWGSTAYLRAEQAQSEAAADPCAEAGANIEDIWGAERKRAVRDAFTQTKVGYAEGTWTRVQTRLDDHAKRWTDAQQAVCRATAVDKTQPEPLQLVRQACLNRRLSELRAHVAVFAQADPRVVQRAVAAIDELHDPDECRTVQTMRIEMPLPADEAAAIRVAEQRQHLDDVMALITTGKRDEALELAQQVVAEAETLAYLPFSAEAYLRLGVTLDKKGRYEEAAATLGEALTAAEVGRHDAAAVDAWNEWLRTVGYHQGQHDLARATLPRLDAALRRLGDDPIRQAAAFKTRGTLAYAESDFASAVQHFRSGKQILERELGADHSQTAILYQNLGTSLERLGRYDDAEPILRRGLEIWSANRGSRHPGLAAIHETLGDVALGRDDAKAAVHHFGLALELFMDSHDERHPETASRYRDLGVAHGLAGQRKEALEWFRKALDAEYLRLDGPEPPFLSSLELGLALIAAGRAEDAVPVLEAALAHPEAPSEPRPALRFALARALWSAEPRAKSRARQLATTARSTYTNQGSDGAGAEVQSWLDRHRG
ncbi:MAG: serine/threonine-protein kinase [Myxococcota bacterium]